MSDSVELRMLRQENYRLQHLHNEEFKLPTDELMHLKWIYNRLLIHYDESGEVDYMRKLEEIILKLE